MKQIQALLFLMLILLSSTDICAQKDTIVAQRAARNLVREGNKLYKKEKYDDASIAYRKALDQNSQYKKATYNLGNSMYQNKKFKEAVPQYELAVKAAKDKIEKADG
jgi:tetratricopeptide (TPR) repeat protein